MASINGTSGNDVLVAVTGADTLIGGLGNDTYIVDVAGVTITESAEAGTDTVRSSVSFLLGNYLENLTLTGSAAIAGTGNALDNVLTGNAGANTLNGGDGNDRLDGGVGADTLIGGVGDDVYVIDNAGDVVTENAGEGTDSVRSSISYTLGADVENLTLTGAAAINGTGNSGNNALTGNSAANVLTGGAGADTLDGGAGADTMVGDTGDDVYVVDAAGDVVTEAAGEGTDTVRSAITYTLASALEHLVLTGSAAINGTGNSGNNALTGNVAGNVLTGGAGSDTLDGGAGSDTLVGGAGDDTYVVNEYGDVVTEAVGEGTDLVQTSITLTLAANVENLTLIGSDDIDGTGNALTNVLTGNAGDNTLDGGAGADIMMGGAGDDTYVVDVATDVVVEASGQGTDRVRSAITYTLADTLENLTLTGTAAINGTGNAADNAITGNGAANTLTGGDGADTLDGGAGADTLVGGAGDDTYVIDNTGDVVTESSGTDTVRSSISYTLGSNLEHLTLIGSFTANGTGNAGANILTGNTAANVLTGDAGNDTLDGGAGADTLVGGTGDDVYVVDSAADVITETAGEGTDLVRSAITYTLGATLENLTLIGTAAINGTGNGTANVLTGNSGNNTLDGGAGADTLAGGAGNDTYIVSDAGDVVTEAVDAGIDLVKTALSHVLAANVENLTLTGSSGISATGNASDNVLTGNNGANLLSGNAGDDTLDGGAGADTLVGGDGDDVYVVDNASDVVTEEAGGGIDLVRSAFDYTLGTAVENLTLTGTSGIDGTGNDLDNLLTGNRAANVLTGAAGADTLDGGLGADTLVGGAGNDVYLIDSDGDVVTEEADGGTDLVRSSVSHTLGAAFENLTLTGTASVNATGNAMANILTGNSGANLLDGGAGADTLIGGAGDDTYVVDDAGDVVTELGGGGTDHIRSALSYTLGATLENLTLTGSDTITGTGNSSDNVLTGNSAANLLTGEAGDDTLDGGADADTLIGGAGDDVYVVDSANDMITEAANGGTDTVLSGSTYTLGTALENLTLTGNDTIDGTGNGLDNVLTGNEAANTLTGAAGDDTLDGGAGADSLYGGAGDDVYIIGNAGDVVFENTGEGVDLILSSVTQTLMLNIENLTLTGSAVINGTGNALANVLRGNIASNTLNGGAGADTMIGGAGNDIYVVDSANDVVTEVFNQGIDTVRASVSRTLGDHLENLTLTGSSDISGTGNDLDNILTGNSGANTLTGGEGDDTLDGGAGVDTMVGGLGDDVYVVSDLEDTVTEAANAGIDLVQSAQSFTLGANIENLTLTGEDTINGTGNGLDNLLTGNVAANQLSGGSGADTLDGGAGADTLIGGAGNDVYVVDDVADVVTEALSAGTDVVRSTVTYTLSDNVENLTLIGTAAINGTGNTAANVLSGNGAANTLDGGAGGDTMAGGAGNDTYVVDASGDLVIETANAGTDSVRSAISYTLGDNVENLTLTGTGAVNGTGNALNNILIGNGAANRLTGGEGADMLDGGAGADTMLGGQGNDLYLVDVAGDVVTEDALAGADTVRSAITYTLGANLENLELTGTTAINGTGNALANALTGNSAANTLTGGDGADTLDGAEGADSLVGGKGDDVYVVDDLGDSVTEAANAGTDLVRSEVTFLLGSNLENLTLIGTAAINGTGNALNNTLTGNAFANTLDGGVGADSMSGAAGDDTYVVDNAGDVVTELAAGGTDLVRSSIGYVLGANLENLTLTGTAAINGTGNALANVLTGNGAANTLDGAGGADTMVGGAGDDLYFVDHAGDEVTELAGGGNDLVRASVTHTLDAQVEDLTLTGTAAINGTGNALDNTLTGNAAVNVLTGGDGADTLDGSKGADTLVGGAGDDFYFVDHTGDVITEQGSEGDDYVMSSVSYTLGSNVEDLTLTGTAAINATGNGLANNLSGNNGANIINGGSGDDRIWGAGGNDTLTGGAGADTFVFNQLGGVDRITDFVSGTDSIALAKAGLAGLPAIGTLTADAFWAGTAAHDATDRVIYNVATGALYYDSDGAGGASAIQIATLDTKPTLVYSDVLIF